MIWTGDDASLDRLPLLMHQELDAGKFITSAASLTRDAETGAINRVKARLGVPNELASCHTAELAGYVIEGHVPAASIKRLLAERPEARGLAVPGMPIGSPGMEVPGLPDEEYAVILFGSFGQSQFSRYRGIHELLR